MNIQLRGTCWWQPASLLPDPHSTETHEEFIAHFNHTQRMNWQEYQADRSIIYILFAYPSDRITSTFPVCVFFHLLQGQLGMQGSLGSRIPGCMPGCSHQIWRKPSGEKGWGTQEGGGLCSTWLRMKKNPLSCLTEPAPCSASHFKCWCATRLALCLTYHHQPISSLQVLHGPDRALHALWGQTFAFCLSLLTFKNRLLKYIV